MKVPLYKDPWQRFTSLVTLILDHHVLLVVGGINVEYYQMSEIIVNGFI